MRKIELLHKSNYINQNNEKKNKCMTYCKPQLWDKADMHSNI